MKMDENSQETIETTPSTEKTEDNSVDSPKPSLDKTDSLEDSTSLDQTEEHEIAEDFNSARSHSNSECSNGPHLESEDEGEEDDDASVILEREEGDGQESTPNRKVDDDEDKRNPQYIPKKGTFYEHDDRTAAEEGNEEPAENPEAKQADKDTAGKKKVWLEKEANKWSHDRFNDQEQAPKSRQELIAIYGYDIRNEEGPPRARRRRRYGRGPNKYTRNWEDEEAYSKPTNVSAKPIPRKPRTKPGQDEFPPLDPHEQRSKSKSSDRSNVNVAGPGGDASETIVNKTPDVKENIEKQGNKTSQVDERGDRNEKKTDDYYHQKDSRTYQQSRKEFRGGRSPNKKHDDTTRASVANNVRGVTKTRGFFKNGGRGMETTRARNQKNHKPNNNTEDEYSDYILSQNFTNKSLSQQQNVQKLEKDMANMSMQQTNSSSSTSSEATSTTNTTSFSGNTVSRGGKFGNTGSGGNRQASVPPRLQQEQRGSKRYSSLRQRSLPETAAPNYGPQPTYYQAEYSQQQQPTSQSQTQSGLLPHPQPSIHSQVSSTTTPQMITVAPSQSINPIPHQGPPANGTPIMQGPPQFAPQPYPQAPPPFIQPPVAPGVAPFIPQQAPPPQIINYAQPQFPGQFGSFQHQQFNPVNQAQPTELYQPQGGITYYSTQNQQVVPRVPQKRVKAAIPIVPPPEHKEPRGRGRLNQEEQESPGGSAPETPADGCYSDQDYIPEAPVAVQQ